MTIPRRHFCSLAASAFASVALGSACRRAGGSELFSQGRLTARPRNGVTTTVTGRVMLGFDSERDTVLQVPKGAGQSPLPLLLMLHGSTQTPGDMFWYLGSSPDEVGMAVLAPFSRHITWDGIRGKFGPDVELLNRALDRTFETVAIDSERIAIGGFSDGASYALTLGLLNGDLFRKIVAFSPGFLMAENPVGSPQIFISHGTEDQVLPIDVCGRRIAFGLSARGYNVTFREFDGFHEILEDVAREGLKFVSVK